MNVVKNVILNYNCFVDNDANFFENKMKESAKQLQNQIYDGYYITDVINVKPFHDKKINNDGSVNIRLSCTCKIIDPVVNSIYTIEINNVSKMGYSFKTDKLCIFLPLHLCNNSVFKEGDNVQVEIIGKRIEEDIICIGKPI